MNAQRILIPLDLEQERLDGLAFVAGLAAETPILATLLYVVSVNVSLLEPRVYRELCSEHERRLAKIARAFFTSQLPQIHVRVGRPHRQILAEAADSAVELIVLSGRTGPRRTWWPTPSTVERVVRYAPCLTLVLPRSWKNISGRYRSSSPSAFPSGGQPLFSPQ